MEYQKNYKYFFPNWMFEIIGSCIGGFGLIVTLITRFRSSYFLGLTIVGFGITIFFLAGKLRDADVDDQVNNVRKTVTDKAMKEFAFTERQLKGIVLSKDFGEYIFPEDEELHIRRGSDEKFRSSEYVAWSVSIGKDDLYFFKHRVCLSQEKESTEKKVISLDDYAGAKISEHIYTYKYGKDNSKTSEIKHYTVDVSTTGGETYSLPVQPDAELDELIERIDHIVRKRRMENSIG